MKNEKEPSVRALILAGGKGTRSENPLTPKILQSISGGKLLLDLLLENLRNRLDLRITLLLGYLYSPVIQRLTQLESELEYKIDWVVDKEKDTPVSAVYGSIQKESDSETIFIVVLGDILVNVNFAEHVATLRSSELLAMILVHPNLHPSESDVLEYGENDKVLKLCLKGAELSGKYPVRAIAGVYFLKKSSLKYFNLEESDITKGVVVPLFNAGQLMVVNTLEYFQDTGTKSRLGKARMDYASGAYDLRGKISKSCIFLDRDGTLIPDTGTDRKVIVKSDISDETIKSIATANESGVPLILITNQPGIAKGFITVEDFLQTQYQLEALLNANSALLDDFIFCPHHPERGYEGEIPGLKIQCDCRKPGTGMIKEMARRHNIDITTSILIGNSDTDCETARTCGMKFLKVAPGKSEIPDISSHIYQAISRIKS
jgi:histidinol-phosphate phosphatase family protein